MITDTSPEPVTPPMSADLTGSYRWALVGMLWFICFFNYADRVAISSVFPILQKQYHFTKTELGWIAAAFTWVYAAFAPIAGDVGDRRPRKWVVLAGLYIWSAVTGLTGLCSRVWQFVVVRGAEGLGETFYFPASMALISDYHTGKTRSRAIGLHQTSIYAGTIFGGTAAGLLAEKHGWQTPFWAFAIAGITLGAVLSRFVRDPRRQSPERLTTDYPSGANEQVPIRVFLSQLFQTPTAALLLAAYFGANMVGFVPLAWMPTFIKEKFNVNLATAGFFATVFIQSASMVGAVVGGVVADIRVRKRKQGRIEVQAAAILLGTPFLFLCGWAPTKSLLVVGMCFFGLCKGIYDASLTASYYDVIQPARRSTATGIMNLIGWIGAGIGAVAIGFAVDHGFTMSAAISSTAIVYLLVGLTLWLTASATAVRDISKVDALV
jgi:MFS family permease